MALESAAPKVIDGEAGEFKKVTPEKAIGGGLSTDQWRRLQLASRKKSAACGAFLLQAEYRSALSRLMRAGDEEDKMKRAAVLAAGVLLGACGGGGGGYDGGGGGSGSGSGYGPMSGYTVGGTISGLSAMGMVVLQNNGGDDLSVSANGTFTFATRVASGMGYNVTVASQPVGQSCSVANGTGMSSGSNVTTVTVMCR